jgi:hypothetical protein
VVEHIILDISISGKSIPKGVTYFNTGCSTFSDLGVSRSRAEDLVEFLKTGNYNGTILLVGYQNPSCTRDPSIGGRVYYKLCTAGVTEAFDPCPAPGSDCYYSSVNEDNNASFTCVNGAGAQVTATCTQRAECAADPDSCKGTHDGTITY